MNQEGSGGEIGYTAPVLPVSSRLVSLGLAACVRACMRAYMGRAGDRGRACRAGQGRRVRFSGRVRSACLRTRE
jgi:hypothetical protein